MRKSILIVGALLLSCGVASAQKPDPDDGYWGPRDRLTQQDTFSQRWAGEATKPVPQPTPRLGAEGDDMDKPGLPETTGRAEPSPSPSPPSPRNSPDPNPRPGEQPRPIPK